MDEYLEIVEGEKGDHDLLLFALSTCGWCRKARNFLDGNSLAYRYVYVDLLEGDAQKEVFEEVKKRNPRTLCDCSDCCNSSYLSRIMPASSPILI